MNAASGNTSESSETPSTFCKVLSPKGENIAGDPTYQESGIVRVSKPVSNFFRIVKLRVVMNIVVCSGPNSTCRLRADDVAAFTTLPALPALTADIAAAGARFPFEITQEYTEKSMDVRENEPNLDEPTLLPLLLRFQNENQV